MVENYMKRKHLQKNIEEKIISQLEKYSNFFLFFINNRNHKPNI